MARFIGVLGFVIALAASTSASAQEINIERFSRFQNNPKYLHDRTVEILGLMFTTWPNYQVTTARNARKSALHDRLADRDMAPENAWRVLLDGEGRLIWVNSEETVTRQPARNAWQRVMDWFFKILPKSQF